MDIKGTLTERDLRAAMWAHIAPRRSIAVLGALVLLLMAWALWMSFFGQKPDPGGTKWVMLGFLLYLIFSFGVYMPYRVRREYRQHKALQRELALMPSASDLSVITINATAKVSWSDFHKWKESRDHFLLYISDEMYYVVPKRFFSTPTDIDDFRNLLRQRVGA